MKEITEFRINYDYAHLLFSANEGEDIGQLSKSVKVIRLSKEDQRYYQIPIVAKQVKQKYNKGFFFGWRIIRKYNKHELNVAKLFHIKIKTTFEPSGEECGTLYNEKVACEICGANREQIGSLFLKKGSIPKKDIIKTIGGEVIVSKKLVDVVRKRKLKGVVISEIITSNVSTNYYQINASCELKLTINTIAGNDPFTKTNNNIDSMGEIISSNIGLEKEIYVCPKGHLIGLNLLSEPHVFNASTIQEFDFFKSEQKIGVKRELLRPEPLYLCSPDFKKMVEEESLTGFDFEVAHIEPQLTKIM